MRFDFLFPGKTKEKFCRQGIDDFYKRLSHYVKADIRIIKEAPLATGPSGGLSDAGMKLITAQIRRPTFLVMLDSSGRLLSSERLARTVKTWEMEGAKHITFLIGGPTGIPPQLLEQADLVLSLSPMTFTHDMARLLLLEQLYRAFTINAGLPYHK